VRFHRFNTYLQLGGDSLRIQTFRYMLQNLPLATGKMLQIWISLPHRGVDIADFNPLPSAISDGYRKLVRARGIEDFRCTSQR
jgi:hypothetical protein